MHHKSMDLVNLLLNGGKAARKAIEYLRTGADVAEQADTLRHLDQYPAVKSRVVGNCVVKEWKDVWNTSPPVSIRNSQKAINWFSVVFLHCQNDLKKHIDLRSVISNHALKGQFDLAEAALDKHFLELGPSLWSLYWHFLITEERGGSAARVSLLDRFREGDIGKLIPYCAAYFSLGTDKSLPEEHHQNTYRETVRGSKSPISKFFELIFLDDISGDWKAWELLEYAERLPLVDRYEVFIRLGIIAFADRNSDSVKFGRAFSKLAAVLSDAQLQYAAEIVEPAKAISATSVTRTYFEAWDRYVLSQYQQCKKLCQAISAFDPALPGPHELYVRAAMYLREDDAFSGTQPVNQLLHHMRNVLSKNEQTCKDYCRAPI